MDSGRLRHPDGAVQPGETVLTAGARVLFVLHEPVVKGHADNIEPEGADHIEVAGRDPVGPIQLHQPILLILTETRGEVGLEGMLIGKHLLIDRQHPHLEQEPVSEVASPEQHWLTRGIDEAILAGLNPRQRGIRAGGRQPTRSQQQRHGRVHTAVQKASQHGSR